LIRLPSMSHLFPYTNALPICALWGGENRIRVNLKFFVYTFLGSLVMLIAIIFLHLQVPERNFELFSFYQLALDPDTQGWIFLALDRKSTRLNSSHVKISYAVF